MLLPQPVLDCEFTGAVDTGSFLVIKLEISSSTLQYNSEKQFYFFISSCFFTKMPSFCMHEALPSQARLSFLKKPARSIKSLAEDGILNQIMKLR